MMLTPRATTYIGEVKDTLDIHADEYLNLPSSRMTKESAVESGVLENEYDTILEEKTPLVTNHDP